MSSPADSLLLILFQNQLLDPAQLAAVRGWATEHSADTATAIRELVTRGWLTPFQAREIASGKVRELTIGKFVLLDVLGEGGMGRVYKARDTRLGRIVALKVIRKDKLSNRKVIERFEQEIRAGAKLDHANVVKSFDAEASDNEYYLAMEFVEGTDLTKLVRQNGPMPVQYACEAIRQAAVGLQHAFERGLVHRDIKPSNLLYTPRGQVKVLDLGLALLQQAAIPGGENANRVTQEGFVLGTPDFLAPEQAQNPTGVDIRADIYALGATLYYLLTARVPYEAATPTEKLLKHITEPPPNLLAVRPDAPPQLAGLIAWLMAKRPEDRPQSPAQVALALAPFGLPQAGTQSHTAVAPLQPPAVAAAFAPAEELVADADPLPSATGAAFADLDVESREQRLPKRSRARDDDRPRRRGETRVKEPKKASSLPLLLIGAGVLLAVCTGTCIVGGVIVSQMVQAAKPLDPEYTTKTGNIQLKLVKEGTFDMGSPDAERGHQPDEGPVRAITISKPFYIGTTEITRQQYTDVVGKAPTVPAPVRMGNTLPRLPAPVSWDEANEFCKKLNARETGKRDGWEFRLPTEAEWEYCARCGKGEPFGDKTALKQYRDGIFKLEDGDTYGESIPEIDHKYNFGDKPCAIAPHDLERRKEWEKEADYQYRRDPNAWGLYDMSGNVWELCRDRYENYPSGAATDPTGPTTGMQRVARGGAFNTTATQCRASARMSVNPTKGTPDVGFRIVYAPKVDK